MLLFYRQILPCTMTPAISPTVAVQGLVKLAADLVKTGLHSRTAGLRPLVREPRGYFNGFNPDASVY